MGKKEQGPGNSLPMHAIPDSGQAKLSDGHSKN